MTSCSRRLAGVALALLLVAPVPSLGQTGDPVPLRLEAQQLSRELEDVRSAVGELPEGRAMAVLQSRLLAIEEELRRLTGRLEEAEHREEQTRERIDRLVADLDRRLATLEQGPQSALATAPAAAGEGEPDAARTDGPATPLPETLAAEESRGPVSAEQAAPEVPVDPSARQGYVLGTIPRDAVLGIPQPGQDGAPGSAPRSALEGSASARYSAALDLLQNGDYGAAEVAFSRWLADYPDADQAPEAAYWLGEAQLARQAYADAAASFAGNYRTYGADAPRAADNLLKLGTALAALGDSTRACQTFTEMGRRYPNVSTALRQALERERRAAGCS